MNDFERLQTLIGREFNIDNIISEMLDQEYEIVINKVEGYTSNIEGSGKCQLYNVYYNDSEATIYDVWIDCNNIIAHIE